MADLRKTALDVALRAAQGSFLDLGSDDFRFQFVRSALSEDEDLGVAPQSIATSLLDRVPRSISSWVCRMGTRHLVFLGLPDRPEALAT